MLLTPVIPFLTISYSPHPSIESQKGHTPIPTISLRKIMGDTPNDGLRTPEIIAPSGDERKDRNEDEQAGTILVELETDASDINMIPEVPGEETPRELIRPAREYRMGAPISPLLATLTTPPEQRYAAFGNDLLFHLSLNSEYYLVESFRA